MMNLRRVRTEDRGIETEDRRVLAHPLRGGSVGVSWGSHKERGVTYTPHRRSWPWFNALPEGHRNWHLFQIGGKRFCEVPPKPRDDFGIFDRKVQTEFWMALPKTKNES